MNKKLYRTIALLIGLSCLTGISAQARYESPEQLVVRMKPMSGGDIDEQKMYVRPLRSNASAHFGLWFETDVALTDISVVSFEMQCETIEFLSCQSPINYAYSEAQEFTHTDGNVYSSRFKPYCFGRINDLGNYEHGASFCLPNITPNEFTLTWDYDYHNPYNNGFSAEFFGDASDSYSFIEFDVNIPENTPPGTYPITFSMLDVRSDHSIPDEENPGKYISYYSHMTPVYYEAEIVVTDYPRLETDIPPVFRYAEDTQEFSVQDFPSETTLTYNGESFAVQTEDLLEFFEAGSPSELNMENQPFRSLTSEIVWEDMLIQDNQDNFANLEYRIGRRGDANIDGVVNAADAALILTYAADKGAGIEPSFTGTLDSTEEAFARFLADIDGKGESSEDIDATDAARILKYAALAGSGHNPDWNEIT